MKQLVEFPTDDGSVIVIEIEAQADGEQSRQLRAQLKEPQGVEPVARGPAEIIAKAQRSFEQALERVKPIATGLKAKLGSLHDPPDEIEVEFGLNMSIEGGAIVAKGGVGANFKIKLKWLRE